MTEDHDTELTQLFRDVETTLSDDGFSRQVMARVDRYERHTRWVGYACGVVVFILVWLMAPELQRAALLIALSPWQAGPGMGSALSGLVQSPWIFSIGALGTGYLLFKVLLKKSGALPP